MRTAILAASAWLTLLGTIALSQSVTFDYDRTATSRRTRGMPGRVAPSCRTN